MVNHIYGTDTNITRFFFPFFLFIFFFFDKYKNTQVMVGGYVLKNSYVPGVCIHIKAEDNITNFCPNRRRTTSYRPYKNCLISFYYGFFCLCMCFLLFWLRNGDH